MARPMPEVEPVTRATLPLNMMLLPDVDGPLAPVNVTRVGHFYYISFSHPLSCSRREPSITWPYGHTNDAFQFLHGLAAGRLRPCRAGAAGRRRLGRLSVWRLPGDARSRDRTGLGLRRLHRRHQFGNHRGQSAGTAAGAAENLLAAYYRPHGLGLYARWRHLPPGAQRNQRLLYDDVGSAGLFRTAQEQPLARLHRLEGRHQLLRECAPAGNPAGAGRFRSYQ